LHFLDADRLAGRNGAEVDLFLRSRLMRPQRVPR